MKTTHKKGFTLIELMAGMLALSVVSLTIGLLLVYGWKGWRESNEEVRNQRDLTLAHEMISRQIRSTPMTNIVLTANSMSFGGGADTVRKVGSDLVHYNASGTPFVLMDGTAQSFDTTMVTNNGSYIRVSIGYETALGKTATQRFVVHTRN